MNEDVLTLATKLFHRHEHSGFVDTTATPQRRPYRVKTKSCAWLGFLAWAIYGAAIAIAIVWGVREVLHG